MNWKTTSPVLLPMLALACTGCGSTFAALSDPRVLVQREACHLGDAIVADKDGAPVQCVPFEPEAAQKPDCTGWQSPHKAHTEAINAMLKQSGALAARLNAIPSNSAMEVRLGAHGELVLSKGGVGVAGGYSFFSGKAEYKQLDLMVDIFAASFALQPPPPGTAGQAKCLAAQTEQDLKSQGVVPAQGQRILGYVSRADIGYLHVIHLKEAKVDASAGSYFKIDASAFSMAVGMEGTMDAGYLPTVEKVLKSMDGTTGAIVASELINTAADHIQKPATVFVSVTPFPAVHQ